MVSVFEKLKITKSLMWPTPKYGRLSYIKIQDEPPAWMKSIVVNQSQITPKILLIQCGIWQLLVPSDSPRQPTRNGGPRISLAIPNLLLMFGYLKMQIGIIR